MSKDADDSKIFKEKEYYREQIVKMVGEIDSVNILNYIHIIISDIINERKNNQ